MRVAVLFAVLACCLGVACDFAGERNSNIDKVNSSPHTGGAEDTRTDLNQTKVYDLSSIGAPHSVEDNRDLEADLVDISQKTISSATHIVAYLIELDERSLKREMLNCQVEQISSERSGYINYVHAFLRSKNPCSTSSQSLLLLRKIVGRSPERYLPPHDCHKKYSIECVNSFFPDISDRAIRSDIIKEKDTDDPVMFLGYGFDVKGNIWVFCAVDRHDARSFDKTRLWHNCVDLANRLMIPGI